MIPIVEDYLSELLQNKLTYLKNNPNHLDGVLGTSQDRINRLKTFLQTNPVKVIKGYPRTPAELPCICILLSGEEETQEGVGDYDNVDDIDFRSITESVKVVATEGARLPIPYIELINKPVIDVSNITHDDLGVTIDPNEYDIANPDLGLISFYTGLVEHGDTLTVTYSYRAMSRDLSQVMYESNYRLEVWSSNADLVVELYHLVKWSILSGRDYLGKDRDLFRQRSSGADFEPAPNYFPEFVYRRALNFWCQFTASVPVEDIEYISDVSTSDSIYFDTNGGEK